VASYSAERAGTVRQLPPLGPVFVEEIEARKKRSPGAAMSERGVCGKFATSLGLHQEVALECRASW